MKIKTKILLISLSVTLLLLSSCSMILDKKFSEETAADETEGKITLNMNVTRESSRTIGYTLPDTAFYELSGSFNKEDYQHLETWTDITKASVNLNEGSWDFILNAYDSKENMILKGVITDRKISEPGTLNFVLTPLDEGTGTVEISLTWPSDSKASSVTTLYNMEEVSPALTPVLDSENGIYRITYTNNEAQAGTTLIVFKLYDTNSHLAASVTELIWVRGNLKSSKTIALTNDDMNSPPAAPVGLKVTRVPNTTNPDKVRVNLEWTDSSKTETGFDIYRQEGSNEAIKLGNLAAGATEYADETAVRGTTYTYSVLAKNELGESSKATASSVTIPWLITLNPQGGNIDTTKIESNADFTVTAPANPTRDGYNFEGWYKEAAYTNKWDFSSDKVSSNNTTLYAKWLDTAEPTPGMTLGALNATVDSIELNWSAASDNSYNNEGISPLQYLAYYSTSDNLDTVNDIESNGTPVGSYTANITSKKVSGLSADTTYYLNVIVKDEAGNKACYLRVELETIANPNLEYDFSTDPGWTTTGDWEWGTPSVGPGSTKGRCYGTDMDAIYTDGMTFDTNYVMMGPIDLSAYSVSGTLMLYFDFYLETDYGFDYAAVQISTDGTNFNPLYITTGGANYDFDYDEGSDYRSWTDNYITWTNVGADLSSYASESAVYIRWGFVSAFGTEYSGYFIDNVQLGDF